MLYKIIESHTSTIHIGWLTEEPQFDRRLAGEDWYTCYCWERTGDKEITRRGIRRFPDDSVVMGESVDVTLFIRVYH